MQSNDNRCTLLAYNGPICVCFSELVFLFLLDELTQQARGKRMSCVIPLIFLLTYFYFYFALKIEAMQSPQLNKHLLV